MMAESETATASEKNAQAIRVERRPGVLDLLLCWLQPARRAPAADRIPLWLAYLVHLAAAVLLMLGLCYIGDIAGHYSWGHTLKHVFRDVRRGFDREPALVVLVIGGTALGVEAGYLVLAFIFMPWGARDERLRHSFARALRFLWLHSFHAVVLALPLTAWAVRYDQVWSDYYNKNYSRYMADLGDPPSFVPGPMNATAGSATWSDWEKERARFYEQSVIYHRELDSRRQKFLSDQPVHIRYGDIFICGAIIAASVWLLWSLLRAIGADRPLTVLARPPTCEFCGYNLTGTPIESRCPECGIPAIESLGPNARVGTEWEHRDKVGAWRAWWRSSTEAILHPTRLGHQIRLGEPTTDHRWCAVIPLLPLSVAWAGAMLLSEARRSVWLPDESTVEEWVWHWGAWATGASAACSLFVLGLLAAAIVGLIQTRRYGRNLLPAAVRMTSYLGLFGGCGAFFVAAGWVMLANNQARLWLNEAVRLQAGLMTGMAILAGIEVAAMMAAVLLIRYLRKPPATAVGRGLGLGCLFATWCFLVGFWPILFSIAMRIGLSGLRAGPSAVLEIIFLTLLALPHLVALTLGFVLVWKGTTAARYANR